MCLGSVIIINKQSKRSEPTDRLSDQNGYESPEGLKLDIYNLDSKVRSLSYSATTHSMIVLTVSFIMFPVDNQP